MLFLSRSEIEKREYFHTILNLIHSILYCFLHRKEQLMVFFFKVGGDRLF